LAFGTSAITRSDFRQPLDQGDLGVGRNERLHRLEAIARSDFEDLDTRLLDAWHRLLVPVPGETGALARAC
jgi:hypothetical protein